MSTTWDAGQYLRFADERGRAFEDLLARVVETAPSSVVDLGCGPGNMTALLSQRWPDALVLGVDSSEEMIAAAQASTIPGRLEFRLGDLRDWEPETPPEVVVCSATLQWVPGHLKLLPRLVGLLAPGGWLAFQVPGNFDQPSHVLLRELAASERWAEQLERAAISRAGSEEPDAYLRALLGAGRSLAALDVWETTYHHVLEGRDPVLEWMKGTGLRPVLSELSRSGGSEEFLCSYAAVLRAAYPEEPDGRTFFPFRRIFAVVQVQDGPRGDGGESG